MNRTSEEQQNMEDNTYYRNLQKSLEKRLWKEADLATRELMLQIAGADQRQDRLLTEKDIQQFPCSALSDINELWVTYSKGHFGFSIISNLYQAFEQDYSALAAQVGWRYGQDWLNYEQICFTSDAPKGHLPITWLVPTSFWMYWSTRFARPGWCLLLERVRECNL